MKFELLHEFDVDVETFEEITSDPDMEKEYLKLPNLATREMVKEVEKHGKLHREVRYIANGFIPLAIRHVIKPKMLTWMEISTFDKKKHHTDWHVEPFYLKNVIDCRGTYTCKSNRNGGCLREIHGHIKISIPFVGAIAENYIITEMKKNFEVEYEITSSFIERKLKKKKKK